MSGTPTEIAREIATGLPDALGPTFVALDGRSGAGKSVTAAALSDELDAERSVTVLEGDTFYGGGSAATWERRSPEQNAASAFDWRRQRDVLQALRNADPAAWRSFDWASDAWDSDTPPLEDETRSASPADIVVLEGVYGARPENADLFDLRVLLEIPDHVRRRRLEARSGAAMQNDWERRWSTAGDHYFREVMTPDRFDIVIRPDTSGPA